MLFLLMFMVLAAPTHQCFEAAQLEENNCAQALVELDFMNARHGRPRLESYPGVDPYSYAPELLAAPIPGLEFDKRYWRVCHQQLWEAARSARETQECKARLERALHERVARARVELEAKALRALRRYRSRDGFGALRWGMSESEIRARVRNVQPSGVGLASVGAQYGREATTSYMVMADRLVAIDVAVHATSTEDAFNLFSKVLKSFEKQLGDPFIVGERVAWIVGQTRLEVSMFNDDKTHAVHIKRHSIELEHWALSMRVRSAPSVDNTSLNESL